MKHLRTYLLCLLLGWPSGVFGFHIIGGEMYYDCLGNNEYLVTMKIFRDCSSPYAAGFDNPAHIGIYNASGVLVNLIDVFFPGSTDVEPDLSNPCLIAPPYVCVEQSVYQFEVSLPPSPGGYDLVYQRCCRNATIVNIIGPSGVGATYTAHIPDPTDASCNSSPRFNNYPPIVICVNEPLVFDHSATDPDGDELVYSLCTPNQGANQLNPQPPVPPPPPFDPIYWQPPYSESNQVGGTPVMSIDPASGLLTAFPSTIGQFVVGVCVQEYRNGVLLSTNVRDFQFNVAECNPLIVANFDANQSSVGFNDTMLFCGTQTVNFDNTSFGSTDFEWDFGVLTSTSDVSTEENPTFTYPDTGVYKVRLIAAPGLACGDTSYKYVELRNGVIAGFDFDNACSGSPNFFTDQSTPLDGTIAAWLWQFGDGTTSAEQNPAHTYSSPGTYSVTLTAENSYGCTASTSQGTVTVYGAPPAVAGPDTFICDVDAVTLLAAGGVTYSWLPDYNISSTAVPNPVVDPDVTTVYTVTVTDNNGCTASEEVTVQVTDTVIASVTGDTTVCEGELVPLEAWNAVYYQWSPPEGLSQDDVGNPMASPDETTTYFVRSYIGSCFDEDTVTVTVLPKPEVDAGPDTTINQGETVVLNASATGTFLWQPPDALDDPSLLNPTAGPLNTITYTLTATADNGCKESDTVTITVTHIHLFLVPNAFTPNGDGLNDVFQFFTKGIAEITYVKVFSRWGETVYVSDGNESAWDGTHKGKDCEIETYVYLVSGITYDGYVLQQQGTLTLLR
jgi:gliding motility-associated-like protein